MKRTVLIGSAALLVACSSPATKPKPQTSPDAQASAWDASPVPDTGTEALAPDAGGSADAGFALDSGPVDAGDTRPIHPSWSMKTGTPPPSGRWGALMVLVPEEKRFILFGGSLYPTGGTSGETWSYSVTDGAWTKVQDTNPPPARYCHCLAYLPDQKQVLLVGGRDDNGALPPAAWTLDLASNTWTQVQGDTPPGVIGCAAVWMPDFPDGGRAIVFGGGSDTRAYADTWAYDPVAQSFAKLSPPASPPARGDGRVAYDPGPSGGHGRILLHGGIPSLSRHYDDLWSFDGTTWTQLMPLGAKPAGRRVQAAAFDPARREWVLFSGTVETRDLADLWVFEAQTDTWTSLPMDGAPRARGFASFGYIPDEDAYYVFGGLSSPNDIALSDGAALHLRQPY